MGLIFLLTKNGFCFVCDIIEGQLLVKEKVSNSSLITGASCLSQKGVIMVSKAGDLISITINEEELVKNIKQNY